MRRSLVLVSCVFSVFSSGLFADPGDKLQFEVLPPFNHKTNAQWGTVLTDVMNHEAPGDSNTYSDQITLAHETSHGIHSYIRNHLNTTGKRVNGFYLLNNRAAVVVEPGIRKSDVVPYVPKNLQGSRFALYVQGQVEWDDTPLYIFDEWNAYVNGGEAGVDQAQSGKWTAGWRDGVDGIIEFVVYALATGQAVKDRDPNYFKNYEQFVEFLAWNISRSMDVFRAGSQMKEFKWDKQDQYYNTFLTSVEAKTLRDFAQATFGAAWTKQVFGF